MGTMGVFPFQEKAHMVETGIELGTSWLVVRSSDHQATRLVIPKQLKLDNNFLKKNSSSEMNDRRKRNVILFEYVDVIY